MMEMDDGTDDSDTEFISSQVPKGLMYNPPSKDDFLIRSTSSDWREGLRDVLLSVEGSIQNNEGNPLVLYQNDKYVCTYDMYPKAKYHLLLMCRKGIGKLSRIQSLNDLEPSHLSELQEFHTLAKNIASALSNNDPSITMKSGYHALPSFEPLHLHIISSDLDSQCITKRKHIVSFISPLFFVDPESVECHLGSAFVDSLALSVRKERASSAMDSTPMTCPRCKRVAVTVPDWKRHNQQCNIVPTKDVRTGKQNSLLGWTRFIEPPMTSTNFTISESKSRYIIYMAIRERQDSKFANGISKCKNVCCNELQHCLQADKTRHITLFDGDLSADQVQRLKFRGEFVPLKIELDGWQNWNQGAYLKLSDNSEHELKRLLQKIDGLPLGGNQPCNHLSLYRRRSETEMPFADMKREFGKIRNISHDFGTVEGVGIRIKAFGKGYDECKILASATEALIEVTPKKKPATSTVALTTPPVRKACSVSIATALQSSGVPRATPIHLSLPFEKEKLAAVLPGILTNGECQAIIQICDEKGFDQALLNVGRGRQVLSTGFRRSLRCIIDDTKAAEMIFERLKHVLPETMTKNGQSWHCVGLNERFRVLKYEPGDYFKSHSDGSFERQFGCRVGEPGDESFITLMLYLNTPINGGDTNFLSQEGGQARTVNPCTGQGLVFDHSIRHESTELEIGVKYAIRTDVMYRRMNSTMADSKPFVLMLVGLPASGKSYFASHLENEMPSKFKRVCQDSIGNVEGCVDLAVRALAEGKVAIIDRTNLDKNQRKRWTDIAKNARVPCDCVIFSYDKEECIKRCQQRLGHRTLKPSQAKTVVSHMASEFEHPARTEGDFRRLEIVASFRASDDLANSYLEQIGEVSKKKRKLNYYSDEDTDDGY